MPTWKKKTQVKKTKPVEIEPEKAVENEVEEEAEERSEKDAEPVSDEEELQAQSDILICNFKSIYIFCLWSYFEPFKKSLFCIN